MRTREPGHPARWPLYVALVLVVAVGIGLVLWLSRPHVSEQRIAQVGPRQRMAALTNADRAAHDLPALKLQRHVSAHTRRHSVAMQRAGTIFHSTPKQLRHYLEGFRWSTAGENVGVGGSLASLEQAFMDSPDHRANVLNPKFRHIAVGVVLEDGTVWLTVVYWG